MKLQALLAALAVAAIAFAGCSGKDGGDSGDGNSTSSSGSRTGTNSTTNTSTSSTTTSTGQNQTGNGTNRAPTANLTAAPVNGSAPLNVSFLINGTDPDGGTLNWTLAFGDNATLNGTLLPANVTHNYTAAGNYTARLTVRDSANASVNLTVNITVAAGGGGGGPLSFALSTDAPCIDCYFSPAHTKNCVDFTTGQGKGTRCDWTTLPATAAGRAFTVTGGSDPGIEFYPSCSGTATPVGWSDATGATETGTVPAGAGCAVVYEFEETDNAFVLAIA